MAKNTIVIRSVIVPASNLASNFLQLMTVGVGPRAIAKGFSSKLVEINQHLDNLNREVEIKALMARHRDDEVRMRKLETELKSLEDSNKRMSIWPLIEAGEFSTISEGLSSQRTTQAEFFNTISPKQTFWEAPPRSVWEQGGFGPFVTCFAFRSIGAKSVSQMFQD